MPYVDRLIRGALAGAAATIPMSVVMTLWHRRLPWQDREPLPPAKITDRLLQVVGVEQEVPEPAQTGLTLVNHLGYGAAVGAAYEALNVSDAPPSLGGGIAYGLSIWTGSYLGWLPAMGLHRPATRDSLERNLLMIGAHVVWGASLVAAIRLLRTRPGAADRQRASGSRPIGMPVAKDIAREPQRVRRQAQEVGHDMHRRNQ